MSLLQANFSRLFLTILSTLVLLTFATAPRPVFAQSSKGEENGIAHRVARLEAALALLQTSDAQQAAKIAALEAKNAEQDARIAALEANNVALAGLASLTTRVGTLESKTQDMTRLTDPNTGKLTVRFSGVNLQIVDGSGDTEGVVNGTGNLLVGYNELRGGGDNRLGSHNIVVGNRNNYSLFGGLVAGRANNLTGQFASITGGFGSTASGYASSVGGGNANSAIGMASTVSGGLGNIANGDGATISGGTGLILSTFTGWSAGGTGPLGAYQVP